MSACKQPLATDHCPTTSLLRSERGSSGSDTPDDPPPESTHMITLGQYRLDSIPDDEYVTMGWSAGPTHEWGWK